MEKFTSLNWGVRAGRTGRLKLAWLCLAGLLAGTAWAQPANDNFANAAVISGISGITNGNNVNATLEGCEPALVNTDDQGPNDPIIKSVWYAWTAPVSGPEQFNTIGSSFDTVLCVYTTTNGLCDSSLTNIVSDDQSGGNNTSLLSFQAVAGTTYYISVNGYNGFPPASQGGIVLNWAAVAVTNNDNFANAIPIGGTVGTVSGINTNATLEPCELNAVPTDDDGIMDVDNSIWYAWTAPTNGLVEFDTIGSGFDTVLSVYTTPTPGNLCDPNLAFLTADDNSGESLDPNLEPTSLLTFQVVAGTVYYIAVDGNADAVPQNDSGPVVLNWTETIRPPNDNFTNAIRITGLAGTISGDNDNGTLETCESNAVPTDDDGLVNVDKSVWYVWTAPATGPVEFNTIGSGFDTVLSVYTTPTPSGLCDTNLMFVAADDNSGEFLDPLFEPTSQLTISAVAGVTYYIAVEGNANSFFSADSGSLVLNWVDMAPPANDNFVAAAVLTGDSGSTNGDNTYATAEPGEPSHAGFLATKSIWYQWTAPADGEVTLDTLGSLDSASNNLDTVLAVYTGNSLGTLNQVAANDDLYPAAQYNYSGQNYFTDVTNIIGGGQGYYTSVGGDYYYEQPYLGPSGLRFNAKAGTTYYFAVDTKSSYLYQSSLGYVYSLPYGNISFNWSYHPSGVFRFATEDVDQTGSAMLLYKVSEIEGENYVYYGNEDYVDGALVTVTRVAGSSGRVEVDYSTADGLPAGRVNGDATAVADVDYIPVSGTLTFDDFEMSKTIVIPVFYDGGLARPNRDFSVFLSNPRRDTNESTEVSAPRVDPKFGVAMVRILDVDTDPKAPMQLVVNLTTNFLIIPFQFLSEMDMTASNGAPTGVTVPINLDTNDPAVDTSGFTINTYNLGATNIFLGVPATNTFAYSVTIYTNPATDPITFSFTNNLRIHLADGTLRTNYYTNNINLTIPLSIFTNSLTWATPSKDIFNFYSSHFRVLRQNGTYSVYVTRVGNDDIATNIYYHVNNYFLNNATTDERNNEFPLQPGSDYATPTPASSGGVNGRNPDFNLASGTLSWGKGDYNPKPISFTIINNGLPEFNEDFQITIFAETGKGAVSQCGMVADTDVTIVFNPSDPPAGSVDEYYNPDYGENMSPFADASVAYPGADGEVYSLKILPSGKTVIGGHFPSFLSGNSTFPAPNIARLNKDGSLDTTFTEPSSAGPNDFISSLALDSGSRIVVGGSFTSYNGNPRSGIARLNANGSLDGTFFPGSGANGPVWSVLQQPDGQILIGGAFTSYNGVTRNHVARLNPDGSLDTAFNPQTAINNTVYAMSLQTGSSTNINTSLSGTNQLENDNTIGAGASSGTLTLNYNMQFQTNELQVYYGGDTNGPLIYDTGSVTDAEQVVISFAPTNGVISSALTVVVNPFGNQPGTNWNYSVAINAVTSFQVAVGGDFTSAGGIGGQDHVARLNSDGSLDSNFDPGSGANGTVRSLATQADGKLLVGGEFTRLNSLNLNRLARLNADGTTDTGFFNGIGADGTVYDLDYQKNGTIYLGGAFTSINGTHRLGFARLNSDGSLDTSFMDTAYNQFAGLPRVYFNENINNAPFVHTSAVQSDGNVMIGGSFLQVGGGQFSTLVRTNSYYTSGLPQDTITNGLASDVFDEIWTRDAIRNHYNVARLIGGTTPGPGNITLAYNSYAANKSGSYLFVNLVRTNGALGYASANFSVVPGVAQSGVDYTYYSVPPIYPITWEYVGPTRMHSDGFYGKNTVMTDVYGANFTYGISGPASVIVSLLNNQFAAGDYDAQFQLANPRVDQFYLGGQDIPLGDALEGTTAPLTIIDDGRQAGVFGFASPDYVATNATANILITRTNGTYGQVQMNYATITNGSTAIAGTDYTLVPSGSILTFNDGQTSATFPVHILSTNNVSPVEKFVNLQLSNLGAPINGVASFGVSNAVLRIINPNFKGFLNFTTNAYGANLSAGLITVTVSRTVGSLGQLQVYYGTVDGPSATNGVDYVGSTNHFSWDSGDVSSRSFTVPLLTNNSVGPNKQFGAFLFNPTLNGSSDPSLFATNGITNAVLTITNDNGFGSFQFSAPGYVVNEQGGYATITVVRSGLAVGSIPVNFTTADSTAFAGTNYVATNGTLVFAQGDTAKSFTVPILDDNTNINPLNFMVSLSVPPGVTTGPLTNVPVNIVDDGNNGSVRDQPGTPDNFDPSTTFNADVLALALQSNGQIVAGGSFTAVDGLPENYVARLNADGSLDYNGFLYGLAGANGTVRALVSQSDDRIVVGGVFTSFDGVTRNRITRLQTDGTLDTSFNPGAGTDGSVFALGETYIGGAHVIYAGGAFTSYDSSSSSGVVRLNDDGSVDGSFAIGSGANGAVYALAAYPTNSPNAGQVLIGGAFTNFNGTLLNRLARLNSDGSMDTNFAAGIGSGANDLIRAIAIQTDGGILIGGDFTNFNGVALNHIARLNSDGTLDTNFTAGVSVGVNGSVYAIALQADNRIVVAGGFSSANGVTRNNLTRLLPDGTVDPTINFGSGANGAVDAVVVQPADQRLVIGGGFTQFDGQPHNHIARLYGGSVVGTGSFEFTAASYQVDENGYYAVISIQRIGGTMGDASVDFFTTTNGTDVYGNPFTAVAGVNFSNIMATVPFPTGEVFETVAVPVFDDSVITPNLTVGLVLSNTVPAAPNGNQSTAVLTIVNVDSAVSFSSSTYQVPKNTLSGYATIDIVRQGSTIGTSTVQFLTTTGGSAVSGTDYVPTSQTVTFLPGISDVTVGVQIQNNNIPEGNTTVGLQLINPAGSLLNAPSNATLTIIDTVIAPGTLSFTTDSFVAGKGGTNAYLTVVRTAGSSGIVSLNYSNMPGTALPILNYTGTGGTLTLGDGVTTGTIVIPLVNNNIVQGNVNFTVDLFNATGGASLGSPASATVTILEDNAAFAFDAATNTVSETNSSILVNVDRLYGANGTATVSYSSTNGTALAGVNYSNVSGTLTFTNGESVEAIYVPILHDTNVTGDRVFTVGLSSPSAGTQLTAPSVTTVVVQDAEAGLSFLNPPPSVFKSDSNAVLTVICSNTNVEPVSVNFSTVPGTALAGVDFFPTNGTLVFSNGISTSTITVGITNDNMITGNRFFTVQLSSPTAPGKLVTPTNQTVTLIDGNSGVSFSSPTYTVAKSGVTATINVVRTGYNSDTVSVDFLATNGTATSPAYYYATNGTLVFNSGQTSNSFSVVVIDNTQIQPNKTVLLQLLNPVNTSVLSPGAATLTIFDNSGSLVIPAGSAIVSDADHDNIIGTNETVNMMFAFRDAGGTNVASLNATLLATNGITAPSAPQNYGPLTVYGPSVFRPFTFTVDPTYTNGQQIAATFNLSDGSHSLGTGVFTYTLGHWTTTFANTNEIVINDDSNATPYPSTNFVSGVGTSLLKATVVFAGLTHGSPSDINALLGSPLQQGTLLMANAGGGDGISGVTLTFDDAATNSNGSTNFLPVGPFADIVVTGTNHPTTYLTPATFPASPSPNPALPNTPYSTNLSSFIGGNPNGTWSLFVLDDKVQDDGFIANGWLLNLTTADPVGLSADVGVGMTSSPVSTVALSNNVTFVVTATNYGPSSATNVVVTDTLPSGAQLVSTNITRGSLALNGSLLTWNLGNLATNAGGQLTIVVQAVAPGSITNSAVAATATTDPNPDDDMATAIVSVLASPAPQPVLSGASAVSGGGFQLTLTGTNGLTYYLQASTNLLSTNWVTISTVGPWSTPPYTIIITNLDSTNYPARFYRAVVAP